MDEAYLHQVAAELQASVSILWRRLRQTKPIGELTFTESTALSLLERSGPTTSAALAREEHMTPQSMGATLTALERQGLVERHPDPDDGRRILMSVTAAGRRTVKDRRLARGRQLAEALSGFSSEELEQLRAAAPLIERLARGM
ncbi:MAG TPA: MarR family transcriptional regulator [Mycobacteriales bacterium]|nr:MarR family transcriptional regulator [Mycobacteriales bacterium]